MKTEETNNDTDVRMVTEMTKEGAVRRPATPEEIERQDKAQERAAQRELVRAEEANVVLALFDPPEKVHVTQRIIEVGDKNILFHIKVLSFAECAALEAKKYRRGASGQIVRDVEMEQVNGVAWLLHKCVVKDANADKTDEQGQSLPQEWVPLFTVDQIKKNLMGNADEKASTVFYSLAACCWEVNPQANPIVQAQALQME